MIGVKATAAFLQKNAEPIEAGFLPTGEKESVCGSLAGSGHGFPDPGLRGFSSDDRALHGVGLTHPRENLMR
jgi:hypothetical protein